MMTREEYLMAKTEVDALERAAQEAQAKYRSALHSMVWKMIGSPEKTAFETLPDDYETG
jgi:hypothetical protein